MDIEIEGFGEMMATLIMAKELHGMGRSDVVAQFYDTLCWDVYYENLMAVTSSLFGWHHMTYEDEDDVEVMLFADDVMSDYFVYAWEHGKRHNLLTELNPYVIEAQKEIRKWFVGSHCLHWQLLGYTKTKKTARRSKLVVNIYSGCSCNSYENLAYALVQLYKWFANKCAVFKDAKDVKEVVAA